LWKAVLPQGANVQRVDRISAATISTTEHRGLDGIYCPCWDWEGDEYVIFRPEVLTGLARTDSAPRPARRRYPRKK
jgi:hypothetical protein